MSAIVEAVARSATEVECFGRAKLSFGGNFEGSLTRSSRAATLQRKLEMKEFNNSPLAPCERLLALPLLELGATRVAEWRLPGMPQGCLDLPDCGLILSGTADLERFDFAMLKTSTERDRDVVLMRLVTGEFPALADIVLRSTAEPILLTNLIPCRLKESLWFVPRSTGRCVEVTQILHSPGCIGAAFPLHAHLLVVPRALNGLGLRHAPFDSELLRDEGQGILSELWEKHRR